MDEAAAVRPHLNLQANYTGRGARPQLRIPFYLRGMEALHQGQEEQALELLRQTLRHPPLLWFIDPLDTCLADAYLSLGRHEDAIREYTRALRNNPNLALARYRLATAYERAGRKREAREEYERFLTL